MRKLRDIDAELKALGQRARQLQQRKVQQLGELVIATGADTLPVEMLVGALLAAAASKDADEAEGWRVRGAAFFQRKARSAPSGAAEHEGGKSAGGAGTQSAAGDTSAS